MTIEQALTTLKIAAKEYGAAAERLLARLKRGEISAAQYVEQMTPLQQAFQRTIEELSREAKDSGLAAIASLKAPEPQGRN